jgi:hypothetical protein
VRGPRDFSRGIRTQFSRTEGSGAPLRRVAVSSSGSLCCPEIFFRSLSIFFSFGIPIEKRTAVLLFRAPGVSFRGVRLSGTGCLAGLPSTAPWEAPSREGLYGRSPSTRQVLSIAFDRFFNLIHTLWITLGYSLLIVRASEPLAAASFEPTANGTGGFRAPGAR